MKSINKSKIVIIICIIGLLQLAASIYFAGQKNYLFFDEVFSYPAANNTKELEFYENQWMDGEWFEQFMSVSPDQRFNYRIPYENQIDDVHPPLFYMFMHTAGSLIPGEFSVWTGVGCNIVFFMISMIVLYCLGKEVLGNEYCGLVAAALYAISYGGLNTMIYIRMYMLMTMFVILQAFVYLKYFEKNKIPEKAYVLLALTLVGGVLSQYYFVFIAFFFGIWYTIKFIKEKKYKILGNYLITIFLSAAGSLLVWPAMLEHLFGGSRGEEATASLFSLDGYIANLKEMFRIMNNDMFTKLLVVILAGMLVLALLNRRKGTGIARECIYKIFVLLFVCTGYFLLVTKVAPYQVDRYVMPIYPLVYLIIVGICCELLKNLISWKYAVILCLAGFGGLSLIHIIHSGIPYTYAKNSDNIERHEVVEEYRDCYALYISDDSSTQFYDAVQMLRKYQGYYYVFDLETVETTKEDMGILQDEQMLLVYIKNSRTFEETNEFINKVFGRKLESENLIDEDEKWSVYRLDF